jgi:hypothetical protein
MQKFTVRVTGTAAVWADIEVMAETAELAKEKASSDIDIRMQAAWEISEGNGVNDWSFAEVFDEGGDEIEEGE